MKVLIAAAILIGVLWLAGVTVIAVWPVVADAPWEDANGESVTMLRCEDALSRRLAAEKGLARDVQITSGGIQAPLRSLAASESYDFLAARELQALEAIITDAQRDIDLYCRQ